MTRHARALLLAAVLIATPAAAHHSFAMYDQTRPVTLRGTVSHVQWTNPHVIVTFSGAAPGGASEAWTLELTSPGNLKRIGWTHSSLPVNQPVEVVINPLRDGRKGGALKKATILGSGQVLTADWLKPGG